MSTFSHTRITSFETCPLRYKYSYIDRIKIDVEDTVETYLGSKVHEALERLYRNLQFEKLMTKKELIDFFREEWERSWKESTIIVKKDFTQKNYKKMGEKYLSDYYKRYKPFKKGRVIGLETTDRLSLDEDGDSQFHIRIDRLMDMGKGEYEVHDYKTNTSLPKQETLDKDKQLAMYSLWVKNEFKDFKKVRLVWHFVAFDKEMDSFRTERQLEFLRKETLGKIRKIESANEFPPKVTRLCDWCLYKGICPEKKHEVQLENVKKNEYLGNPGVKLVDEYFGIKKDLGDYKKDAEKKLEKVKEALISFCMNEDISVVVGSGHKISVKEYESYKFPGKNTEDRAKLVNLLHNLGKFDEVSDLDTFALEAVLKNKKWAEDTLLKISEFAIKEKKIKLSTAKK